MFPFEECREVVKGVLGFVEDAFGQGVLCGFIWMIRNSDDGENNSQWHFTSQARGYGCKNLCEHIECVFQVYSLYAIDARFKTCVDFLDSELLPLIPSTLLTATFSG